MKTSNCTNLEVAGGGTRLSTEQYDDRVGLGRNEAEQKYILAAAVVALEQCFTERSVAMKTHLFSFGTHLHKSTISDDLGCT